MTTAQVVETSVTVNNSPIQDYFHPDDHVQSTYEMTPGFKPFTLMSTVDNFAVILSLTSVTDVNTYGGINANIL